MMALMLMVMMLVMVVMLMEKYDSRPGATPLVASGSSHTP